MIDSCDLFANELGSDDTVMKDGGAHKRDIFILSALMPVF